MPAIQAITPLQLFRLIGTDVCPRLIDVSLDADFAADPLLIPTATRLPHNDLNGITYGPVVIICQKGKKLSQGAAAALRWRGIDAQFLEGGNFAWREHDLPSLPAEKLEKTGFWVTRHRPKVDRIACPWLIRRFVDPNAQFLFVSPDAVLDVAEAYDAIAFDVEGADFSHEAGKCTFDALLKHFALDLPPLGHLARIVRAADIDDLPAEPQAAGFLAGLLGLSKIFRDDLAQLEAGMSFMDAFYRWCRDATEETHIWKPNS